MSVLAQVGLGLFIVAGVWGLLVLACEVSVRLGARAFRDENPEYRRYVRRRLRCAFWNGAGSIFDLSGGRRPR